MITGGAVKASGGANNGVSIGGDGAGDGVKLKVYNASTPVAAEISADDQAYTALTGSPFASGFWMNITDWTERYFQSYIPVIISFDPNGGSGSMKDVPALKDDVYALPACGFTAPAGSVFIGWEANGKTYAEGDIITVTGNMTIKACWQEEKPVIRIAGMKGPTSIGLVGVMEYNELGTSANKYEFTIEGAADAITPKLVKGELDIAAVPANLASILYNNTKGEIKLLAVNTLGVLYILEKGDTIASFSDLKGKTIIATGKGTTPEYTLRYLLSQNGIDPDKDVTLDFKSEATEVVAALNSVESGVAMLPQPYVTVAMSKVEGLKTVLDLNEEWVKFNPDGGIVTGVLVVRRSFAEAYPQAVKRFMEEYKTSVEDVNKFPDVAGHLVQKHGIFDNAMVISKAIPKCNITFISGEDMKNPVNKYLGVLYEQNEKSVGGALPNDDFFYMAE